MTLLLTKYYLADQISKGKMGGALAHAEEKREIIGWKVILEY